MSGACGESLREGRNRLAACSGSPALDAELLLAQVLGCTRASLLAQPERQLAAGEVAAYQALLARREAGEPLPYLTGSRGFWTLDLEVGPAVLVPRPETELLVELALARLDGIADPVVADLGTGSGAIAIAIAVERADARVCGVDTSQAALRIAERNAARHGASRIEWLQGSWFGPLTGRRFNLVASNPPYLAEGDPYLPALAGEPREALVAGRTGLEAIIAICAAAAQHLRPAGSLVLEHGADQDGAVRQAFRQSGFAQPQTHRDLAGLPRVTLASLSG